MKKCYDRNTIAEIETRKQIIRNRDPEKRTIILTKPE